MRKYHLDDTFKFILGLCCPLFAIYLLFHAFFIQLTTSTLQASRNPNRYGYYFRCIPFHPTFRRIQMFWILMINFNISLIILQYVYLLPNAQDIFLCIISTHGKAASDIYCMCTSINSFLFSSTMLCDCFLSLLLLTRTLRSSAH